MNIQVFSKKDCAPCKALKDWLSRNEYEYEDIDAFDNADRAMDNLIRKCPTTLIYNESGQVAHRLIGFNIDEFKQALNG